MVIEQAQFRRIRLLDLPVALYVAAEGQWKALLREYVLRGLGGSVQAYGAPEVARAGAALEAVSAVVLPVVEQRAVGQAPQRADVEADVADLTPGDFAILQAVLDDAVRLSRTQQLLVLPPLPEVIALRNWFCGEAIAQSSGAAPTAWRLAAPDGPPEQAPTGWDPALEPSQEVAWLIGDDHNRIVAVSAGALDLLGWTAPQLVGQRLLAVIPPRHREAHLAAFTSNVAGGAPRILGVPVDLPALTANGEEVLVTLTLTRHRARAGRTVFLGTLTT